MASAGSVMVPVNIDPIISIETLHLDDGDALVLHVPGHLTRTVAEAIEAKARRIVQATGKRVALILLPDGYALDQLSAHEVSQLYLRLQAVEEAGGHGLT